MKKKLKKNRYKRRPQKSTRYIIRSLGKYFGKRYPTYQSKLERARELKNQIQSAGDRIILQSIFALERRPQKNPFRKPPTPSAPEENWEEVKGLLADIQNETLFTPQPFWTLADYPGLIAGMDENINIVFSSELSPSNVPPFRPGAIIGYQEYFADYVNYCNKLIKSIKESTGDAPDSNDIDYYVVCLPPDADGISKIVSVDSEGNTMDFGFDSENPDIDPSEQITQPEQPISKKPQIQEKEPTSLAANEKIRLAEIDAQKEIALAQQKRAEAEIKKSETITQAMTLLQQGKITHAQFDMILEKL